MTAAIQPAIDAIAATLPPGMRIEVGGAVEESAKANAALFKIFPLMFLAMLTILMLQLQRFYAVSGCSRRRRWASSAREVRLSVSMPRLASTRS